MFHSKALPFAALILGLCLLGCPDDGDGADDDATLDEDADGDGFSEAEGDCDDSDPDVHYLAQEVCDGVDNNCDLQVDESFDADFDGATTCGADGVADSGDEDCDDNDYSLNLLDEDGDGYTTCAGDCDDGSPATYPGASEICDGLDNNCDHAVPADDVDQDADGWLLCEGDCDDENWWSHPGGIETCNGLDDDCDPTTDENADADGDGFSVCDGDCDDTDSALDAQDWDGGFSVCDGDCNDGDILQGPAAAEQCDSVDNDCDGSIDEDCITCTAWVPYYSANITQALLEVTDGDVICVDPGTYPETVNFRGLNVHVLGLAGPAATVIDGGGHGSVVTFAGWEGPEAILEGFTITNGNADLTGGGIHVEFADPTLSHLVVTGNVSGHSGGGVFLYNSIATLQDVEVSDNEVTGQPGATVPDHYGESGGGGIYAWLSGAPLDRVTVRDNRVLRNGGGGGLMALLSSLVLQDVSFEGNAALTGAGAQFDDCPEILMDGGAFVGNLGGDLVDNGAGAGLFVDGTVLRGTHVVVAGNLSGSDGAGLDLRGESLVELTHALILGNQTAGSGGGFGLSDADVFVDSAIVAGNIAGHIGGGFDVDWPERLQLVNTIVTGNTASVYAGGLALDNWQDAAYDHCNIWGNTPNDIDTQSNPAGTDGNVSVSPAFIDSSSDDVFDWDLHLAENSPLVDAGDPEKVDPDGSPSDIGIFGGPEAGAWDLDWDGDPLWWQPGAYDHDTYPTDGLDCDDMDPEVHAGSGC